MRERNAFESDAILDPEVRLRGEVFIPKGLLGTCPLSAFLFEGERNFNVL